MNKAPKALEEGSTIGILGGGQLGLMIARAAAELGYRCHIFAPPGDAPATQAADAATRAAYDDDAALEDFAKAVDIVTCEFENVPVEAMGLIASSTPISPGLKALEVAQHRLKEKTLARRLGMATPRFAPIAAGDDITAAFAEMQRGGMPGGGMPGGAILKTCRLGYDGKGQAAINSPDEAPAAFASLGGDRARLGGVNLGGDEARLDEYDFILEECIDFTAEASFLVARAADGRISHFPPSINHHEDGILAFSEAPANPKLLPDDLLKSGQEAVAAMAEHLGVIGLLAMEVFITPGGLIFNEIAPRPHNSFHWTIEGAATSQFSQLVRAITGLPLGGTEARGRWRMDNILGDNMAALKTAKAKKEAETDTFIHIYGKHEARPGRKMGHITRRIG